MTVLIRGMEMPESCDVCWALDDYGDYPRCRITEEQRGYNFPVREKRMDKCPLIELPPHGDLIDRDKYEVFSYTGTEGRPDTFDDGIMFMLDRLSDAPTIIEAEGEKE